MTRFFFAAMLAALLVLVEAGTPLGTAPTHAAKTHRLVIPLVGGGPGLAADTPMSIPPNALIFVVAGQSNASGRGKVQTFTGPVGSALMLGNDDKLRPLADPVDDAASSTDRSGIDREAAGSIVPLLASRIVARTGRPVVFVPANRGGSGIAEWQPLPDESGSLTLYQSLRRRATLVGHVTAVLWWQGESDAGHQVPPAAYWQGLNRLAGALSDVAPLMVAEVGPFDSWPASQLEAIRSAQRDCWTTCPNVVRGPSLADVVGLADGVHFTSDLELALAAERWFVALDRERLLR